MCISYLTLTLITQFDLQPKYTYIVLYEVQIYILLRLNSNTHIRSLKVQLYEKKRNTTKQMHKCSETLPALVIVCKRAIHELMFFKRFSSTVMCVCICLCEKPYAPSMSMCEFAAAAASSGCWVFAVGNVHTSDCRNTDSSKPTHSWRGIVHGILFAQCCVCGMCYDGSCVVDNKRA